MQRFLSGRSVRGLSKVNRRNFQEAKNTLKDFVNGTKQQPTNHLQLHSLMYRNGWKNFNEELYMLKTINWKLKAKYGDSLRFTSCEGRPSIMLLHEEADQIVLESPLETVSNSCNVEKDLRDFFFVGREIAQCLHESSEREEYYPYPATLL